MLFDGNDGIEKKYISQGPALYIIAHDGRVLSSLNSNDGPDARIISLVESNLSQGGATGMKVCSHLIFLQNFDG